MSEYKLQLKGVCKSFPGVKALDNVQLSLRPGTVHALMGENGAGKSTLMKCLFGIYKMDAGEVYLDGQKIVVNNPDEAMKYGIAMVHQELQPVPARTVAENLYLGRFPTKKYGPLQVIDHKKMYEDTAYWLKEVKMDFDPKALLGDLSIGQMQSVEIAKAVSHNAKVVIFDEPTSSLSDNEVEALFRIMNDLRDKGVAMVYISHKMDEIKRIADDITIMRDGTYVGTWPAAEMTTEDIITKMVGRELTNVYPERKNKPGEVVMEVKNLSSIHEKSFQDVSFTLRKGEILGFGGLVGAQRTELVDDEEDVIQIIMKKMDWESMGFQIAGYAHNGVEALEMAEELQPDVVMTDIKMPYMDGLTLSRKLKELYRTVKIIIFSGFDEFEYAKEAIQIEVEEYILKPIDAGNLKEVFGRIHEKIGREMDEKRNVDKLREYYMESLPILQENFYTSLIDGRIPEGEVEKYLSNYQIDLTGPCYVVSILHISTTDIPQNMNPFLLGVSVKKLAEEHMEGEWKSRILMYLGDIVVITQLEEQEQITAFTDFMDQFCRLAKHVCEATVTAGIGYVCDNLPDIRLSWQGARSAVSYRVIYGNARAINIAEIDPMENVDERWEEQEIQKILKRIRMGTREELETEISHCVCRFLQDGTTMQKYQIFIMGLLTELFRFCNNNQLDSVEFYGEKGEAFDKCMQMESPKELEQWLLKVCEKLQETVQQERQASTRSFVSRAVEYVQEHYSDRNITIESVCRELGVSAAYFSTIFKKETGKTFISFLTDYRMEKAVELLMTTSDKT